MKRSIALLVALLLIFTSYSAINVSAASDESKYKSAFDFLAALDIVSEEKQNVTRGDFAQMIVKSLGGAPAEYKNIFADVKASTPNADYIQTAYDMGIINGMGTGNFLPDNPVSYAAVIKMAVAGLGYSRIASALGGFPTGYLLVAKEIGLTSGVGASLEQNISFQNVCILLYNFLNADICEVTGVSGNDVTQARQYGVSPLTRNFNLSKVEGVCKTAGYVSMLEDVNMKRAEIKIGTEVFEIAVSNPEKYIGRDVVAWYGEDEVVTLVYVKPKNSSVIIPAKEIDNFSDYRLTAFNEETNRETKYSIDKGYTFILNGRGKEPLNSDFFFNEGSIELIDNNADNIYDVVYVRKYEYIVASTIDSMNGKVYDINYGGKELTLKKNDGYFYKLEVLDKNGNFAEGTIDNLSVDSVIMYAQSEDGKFVEATACKKPIQGEVSEVSNNEIKIGEDIYKVNSYFKNYNQINPGTNASLLLAPDGTLTAFQIPRSDSMSYGYFIDMYKKKSGVSSAVQVAILTSNGSKLYTTLSDNVTLDGVRYSADDSIIENTFMSGDVPNYQVIRYELDKNGQVAAIDTSERYDTLYPGYSVYDKYKPVEYTENSLCQYLNGKNSFWHAESKVFSPHAIIGDATVLFSVPKELSVNNKRYDEDDFTLLNTGSMNSYGTYMIDAYDLNNQLEPGVIVLYNENAGDSVSVREHTPLGMVEKISKGLNAEGENVHLISIWVNGRYYDYTIDDEVYSKILSTNALTDAEKKFRSEVIMKGDIVRAEANGYGEIMALSVDGRYNPEKKMAEATSYAPADGQLDDSVYSGKMYSHTSNHMSLLVESSFFNSGYSDEMVDGIAPFGIKSGISLCVYDTKTDVVRAAKFSQLKDCIAVGEVDASKIFLKCYSHTVQQIFLYE